MSKLGKLFRRYKKECIALFIFVICLTIFSISYAFAAVEPVRSIVIQSENTDFASGEAGSWQVTKSGYWTNYGKAEVTLDVDTTLMTNNQYTDIIFVLDISGSMSGKKLERVKSDSKELISSLLSNKNNQAALITFDTESRIVSELTNDEELLTNEIDQLQIAGSTNYYQALVNVDSILQDYQKESGREMIVLFLTDGYPNEDTPNQIGEYQYLKSAYPYITVNGIQYEMGDSILNPIKEISDNQFIADMETLNNVLFDASVSPISYDTYQIVDYIDSENFTLESIDDIKVSQGSVELTEEDGKQKIIWTMDDLSSGRKANLTMKLKLKEELIGQGGIYPTNESTKVISKIGEQEENVTTTNTPILADNYKVIYDGNAPNGGTVTNIPEAYNYSVFSTIEISDQVPSCSGYEFKGWTITTNGVTRVSEDYFIMPGEDVVIKAEWSKVGITKSMNGTVNNMGDPIMKSYTSSTRTDYHSSTYKSKITSIVTKDNMEVPSTAIETWDVSKAGDGSVIAYIEDDGRGTGTYKVTIGAQGNIIASSGSYLFGGEYSSNSFSSLETIDLTYLDTSQVTTMDSMFRYCSKLTSLDVSNFDTSQVTKMGYMFYYCRSLPSLDLSNFNTSRVTNMESMFQFGSSAGYYGEYCKLQKLDLSSFDTSQVTNMSNMFYSIDTLEELNISSFDTSKVTNMSNMFCGCKNLEKLDIIFFDTSRVTNMSYMFGYCDVLNNIIFGNNFNTSRVTNMRHMFSSCDFTSLDVSHFDTSQVTDMSGMFSSCSSLTSIDVSNFDTSQVKDMSFMFSGCNVLLSLDLSNFNTSKVTDMQTMFNRCDNLTNLNVSSFDTSKVRYMRSMFTGCSNLSNLNLTSFDTSQVMNMSSMFSSCSGLTSLDLSNFNTSQVTDMNYMFMNCSGLISIDVSHFVTSLVTNMNGMFSGCSSLTSLDLSSFSTSQATNIGSLFADCSNLNSILFGSGWTNEKITSMSYMFSDLSNLVSISFNGFQTANVTNMSSMFDGCSNITSLDLSSFDTSQITNMSSMFNGCSSLTNLNLSSFNTSQVKNMSYMFQSCSKLTNLDLSNFDTSRVSNMGYMFSRCSSLTSLDVSHFDTSQVTNMSYMFQSCSKLTNLDLSNFDTSRVSNMGYMFSWCSSLTSLDVSHFDTSQVTNMSYMFQYCNSLINLDLSNFNTSKVTNISNMFYRCSSLTNLDMRNATFNATSYSFMFNSVPNGITVIVKDATAKTWIEERLSDASRTGTVTIASA